ncbi:MAG: succinate dehydrogenase flavoprotein subunit, partial [Phycisphaerales bacterium JB041]
DGATWTNQSLSFARSVGDRLTVGEAMATGAKARKESRGAHYRIDYPDRDDAKFMKTTFVTYDADEGRARVEHRAVRAELVAPRARTYGKVDKEEPAKAETAAAGV